MGVFFTCTAVAPGAGLERGPMSGSDFFVEFRSVIGTCALRLYSGFQLRSKIAYCVDFHASIEIAVFAHGNYSCTFVF